MENYKEIRVFPSQKEDWDFWTAFLFDIGIEGSVEERDRILAYVPESVFIQENIEVQLHAYAADKGGSVEIHEVMPTNWNANWEENYPMVVIDDYCVIYADFHIDVPQVQYPIRIHPKMSFGTGHHATTELMLRACKEVDFNGKKVFDFGAGTAVLAIMAALRGAKVSGCEIEEWSVENAFENAAANNVNIHMQQSGIEEISDSNFDYIFANINKNVLLTDMEHMANKVKSEGVIWMSGFYISDVKDIIVKAEQFGLTKTNQTDKNEWACLQFTKS